MSKPVCAVVGIGPKNGASFARRFAAEGYSVALLSRRTDYSSQLAEELGDARAFACDVSQADSVAAAFAEIRETLGPVDTLVFNAGSGVWGDIESITPQDFELTWRVNSLGLFLCSQAVIPAMKENGAGGIIVVGATASLRGKPFTTAFAPAKASQRSLAQAMARHLNPQGIHVALLIIDGVIEPNSADQTDRVHPDAIADAAFYLRQQSPSAWTFELDLRPQQEKW